jgi:hypothetical protein
MKQFASWLAVSVLFLMTSQLALAEVKIVVDRNGGDQATGRFQFKNVPAPSRSDAAANAKFTLVDGTRDRNGGDLDALHDGRVAADQDQPDESFFFRQAADGGRIGIDLGALIDIKQVNSYSWHPDTRGPQVFKLYAADGSASDFNAQPKKGVDPEKCGWKLIASVDARPKDGEPGGQYGVSISDSAGPLGKYRHLLLDISRTEDADAFGNTFYTEIDVVDAAAPAIAVAASAAVPAAAPATAPANGKYDIVIDYSEMPELKDWVEAKLRPTLEKWYPIIVEALPSEGYTAPQRFTVTFRKDMRGVAATGGTRVMCAGDWFKKNLDGEAVGAVVHELVHVAQQYRGRNNPGWLVEGVADYLRWFQYEPEALRPRPNPARAKYTDSYRVTAAFLNYLSKTLDKDLVKKFNVAMRQGKYTPDLWKQYTGKTVEELWDDYMKTLQKP